MRVTLIYPSVGRKENTPYVRAWQMQPLSMALLASLMPPDVEVRFYDGRGQRTLAGLQPRRAIFHGKRYQNITLVEFARGCNFKCDFCSITAFHHAAQNHRPAADVAAEMAATGSRRFFIVDDNIVS